jgi:hypothetical protein
VVVRREAISEISFDIIQKNWAANSETQADECLKETLGFAFWSEVSQIEIEVTLEHD